MSDNEKTTKRNRRSTPDVPVITIGAIGAKNVIARVKIRQTGAGIDLSDVFAQYPNAREVRGTLRIYGD
jgi:hypothetical protein